MLDLWSGEEPWEKVKTKIVDGKETYKVDPRFERIVRSYMIGDMLRDVAFRNAVSDSCFELFEEGKDDMTTGTVNLAFDNLPEDSQFTRILAHQIAYTVNTDSFQSHLHTCVPSVWKALARETVLDRKAGRTTKLSVCDRGREYYHIQGDNTETESD